MKAKIVENMMGRIANAVYSAWVEELLDRGVDAIEAHRQATASVERRMNLLRQAWLTVDWLPDDALAGADKATSNLEDPLLRRLFRPR